ncbi:MAG: preprotein translocase subunit YajC [Alphaproteobacteria bacterium]|nr:preprotein translocase subunit YajC [Alphaproteobacteria bacterium]
MEGIGGVIPILLIFGIFYVLLIRPQQKQQEEHDALVKGLAKDDRVVLQSGLHGAIAQVGEATLVLEVAKGVKVTVDKDRVQRKIGADTAS